MSELLKIEGTVEKIMFRNAENGYVVLELYTEDAPVTVTGELGDVEEGEILTLTGKITEHPHYGEQFEAENCERKLPDTT
ncbi:MAG TPA: ATP-dependent RecD-like DNA helicase, partial [Ruminococcus sp.]|nr:ATP-dependent RecD-like DNA helicase [Ruminococcus sp.]